MRKVMLVTVFSKALAVIDAVCDDNCTFKPKGNWINWFHANLALRRLMLVGFVVTFCSHIVFYFVASNKS
jgi:hypothetical protein